MSPITSQAHTPKQRQKPRAAMSAVTAAPVTEQFMHVHRFATRAVARADIDATLTLRQIAILTTLRMRACPDGVKALAEYLRVAKPVVTRALDRLGELGLAERQVNEVDRRTIHLSLTARGEQLTEAYGEE